MKVGLGKLKYVSFACELAVCKSKSVIPVIYLVGRIHATDGCNGNLSLPPSGGERLGWGWVCGFVGLWVCGFVGLGKIGFV